MDILTFLAILAVCCTVIYVTTLVLAHLNNQSSRRHAERMNELSKGR